MKSLYCWLFLVFLTITMIFRPAAWAAAGVKTPIAAGGSHTLAVSKDGFLWGWGYNSHGELGLGDTNLRRSPTQVAPGFVTVASGRHVTDSFSLGVKADGSLWAWGENFFGQLGLGNNDTTDRHVPVRSGNASDWVAVAAGIIHSLGLKANGTLWAWGFGNDGELGFPAGQVNPTPAQVGSDNDWVAIAAGAYYSLGLKADGSLWAWGENSSGQLGLGNTNQQNYPQLVGTGFVAIAAGAYHSLGLKGDGSLWAWGTNSNGQLGLGNISQQNSPQKVGTVFTTIAAGAYHSLALKADGSVWAWGYNDNGQLGTGNTTQQLYPTATDALGFVAVAGGGDYSLGLKFDGSLWGWGSNYYGQLGLGNVFNQLSPTTVPRINAPRAAVIPLY